MGFTWIEEPTTKLTLPSGNTIEVLPVDLAALVLSSDNAEIPNGLLDQIAGSLSGQVPDKQLLCIKGHQLPIRGEPCSQGDIRGKVVDVSGTPESFSVRVSMISAGSFGPGELRFGGMNMAIVESARDYAWRLGDGDLEKAKAELPQMGAFIEMIVRAASVMPKFVKEVTDPETQWPIAKVRQADRMFIFSKVMPAEVRPAGMFPQEPAASVAAAPDVQAVPPESSDGVRPKGQLGEVAV